MAAVTTKVFFRVSAPGQLEEVGADLQDEVNGFLAGLPMNNVLDVRHLTGQMPPAQMYQETIVLYLV